MRLLFADDHTLFRDTLAQYIKRADPEIDLVVFKDLHEVFNYLQSDSEFDLVLLDMRMPGMGGLSGLQKIREVYPDIRVALLSGMAENCDVEQAKTIGAAGYFPKTLSGRQMMAGFYEIAHGKEFFPLDQAGEMYMNAYEEDGAPELQAALTKREKDVLMQLLGGASNKDIANALLISLPTVKFHVQSVCKKLGARNRTHAAVIAKSKRI